MFAGGPTAEPFPAKPAVYNPISLRTHHILMKIYRQDQNDCNNLPDYRQVSHQAHWIILIQVSTIPYSAASCRIHRGDDRK